MIMRAGWWNFRRLVEHLPQGISHQVQVAQESEAVQRGRGEVLQQGGFTDSLPAICVHVWVWVGGSCIHSIVDDCMEGEPTGGENWTLLDKSPQAHPLGGTTNNICNKEIALLIKLRTIENIATGEATRAIASLHFFDYFNFFVSNSVYNTHNTHGFYSV